ncbi:MAG: hypothetical protein M3Q45_01580 [Chloroflexota bacterium]|nr:hypothetical protein [Chloroflexota bacterium]
MKHCPNPTCSFLASMQMVAEFHDNIEVCVDCGTRLVAGAAPEIDPAAISLQSSPPDPRTAQVVTLCTLDSAEDAVLLKAKLEFQDIPVTIVQTKQAKSDAQTGAAEDSADETDLFEVQVLRDHLLRATHLLDVWMAGELDDEVADDTQTDELDDDSGFIAQPTQSVSLAADRPEAETNWQRPSAAASQPPYEPSIAATSSAGFGRILPLVLIAVVVLLLILWWLR